jgi:hypothetical protein
MSTHTHLCEYCGQERQCRCEELAELQCLPCDPCLQDTVIPPWEQKSRGNHGPSR